MINDNDLPLNIFSDASFQHDDACYGAVAVYNDKIIDEYYRINTDTTVNEGELRGIRSSLELALKYRYQFKTINLFSDSLYTVNALRDHSNSWHWDYGKNTYVYPTGTIIANQELIYECLCLLWELMKTNIVCIYHQKGHVTRKRNGLEKACTKFKKYNNLREAPTQETMSYLSYYNDYVDKHTRFVLHRTDTIHNEFIDPINFVPRPYDLIYQNIQ